MKKQIALVALLFLGMSCFNASAQFGKKFNVGKALQAGKDAVQAITLSDADIAAMSKEYMEWMDKHNPLAKPDSEYGKRLERLTGNIKEVDGMKVNFGVYEVVDVNAFACGDGSVRICAGLMDVMNDEEVMAVIGHEIGHVIHTDSKDAMKNAYLRSWFAQASSPPLPVRPLSARSFRPPSARVRATTSGLPRSPTWKSWTSSLSSPRKS